MHAMQLHAVRCDVGGILAFANAHASREVRQHCVRQAGAEQCTALQKSEQAWANTAKAALLKALAQLCLGTATLQQLTQCMCTPI